MRTINFCKAVTLLTVIAASSLLSVACIEKKEAVDEAANGTPETLYQCGDARISTLMNTDGTLLLMFDGEQKILKPSQAASGSKYENPAEETVFWNKGYNATFEWHGQTYPTCSKMIGSASSSLTGPAPASNKSLPSFVATGNTPAWYLLMEDGNTTLIMEHGKRTLNFPRPDATELGVSRIYKFGDLEVVVRKMACTDSADGKELANQVKIIESGKEYMGCGEERSHTPDEIKKEVLNAEWTVKSMSKVGALAEAPVTFRLDDAGRITGSTGCNRYSGDYSLNDQKFAVTTSLATTKRACMTAALAKQERTYMELILLAQHLSINSQGLLEITTRTGKTIALQK